MTDIAAACRLAEEIQADMRWHLDSSGQAHAACTLAAALLAQAEQMGILKDHLRVCEEQNDALGAVNEACVEVERMRPVYEAAIKLDRIDYSEAHYRGCGQSSEAECLACNLDAAITAARRTAAALNASGGGGSNGSV